MRFEHLIQINDPLMPLLTPLSREQLWRGLVQRAERPTEFVLGMVAAHIESVDTVDGDLHLSRTLDFGAFQVHDRVVLTPMQRSVSYVAESDSYPASRLTIEIEEPQPQALFLRFTYESDEAESASELDELTLGVRKQAYEQTDLDTVQKIRELAEAGLLDATH